MMKSQNDAEPKNNGLIGGLAGMVHLVGCPSHGLAAILIKTSLLPATLAAPLIVAHE